MAFLTFRGTSTTPTTPTSTTANGTPLTNAQIDGNFASLDASKLEKTGGTISGDLTVSGNLTVNGTTTTVDSTVVTLKDPVITLGGNTAPTVNDSKDRGVEFRWHNGSNAKIGFFGFDNNTGKFTFIPDATNTSEVFSGTKGTIDANIDWTDVLNKPTSFGSSITDDTSSNTSYYLGMSSVTTGAWADVYVSSSHLYFNPSTGTLNATQLNSLSDKRFKKDFAQITDAIQKVTQLTGYTYTLIETEKRSAGLIAQEVELIQPESVGGTEDKKTLDYGSLMGLIVEAIKELNSKLDDIQKQLSNK